MRRLEQLYNRLDAHTRDLIRHSSTAVVLRVVGAASAFSLNLVLARVLGTSGAGLYLLAFTVVTVAAVVGRVGLDHTMVRFVAAGAAGNEWGRVRGTFRVGISLTLLASAAASGCLMVLGRPLAERVFAKPLLELPLSMMALGVLPLGLYTIVAQALQGLRRIGASILLLSVMTPVLTTVGILVSPRAWGVEAAALSFVAATAATLATGVILWRRAMSDAPRDGSSLPTRELLSSSMPLFAGALLNLAISWAPIVLLGIWGSSRDVGIFALASRTALLLTFVLTSVNSIAAPKFSALSRTGDHEGLRTTAQQSATLAAAVASPLFVLFVAFPSTIMSIFGPDFAAGGTVLAILAVGQFINASTGSVSLLLVMSGNERAFRNIVGVCAITSFTLSFLLIPRLGIVGAAISAGTVTVFQTVLAVWTAWRILKILALPRLLLRVHRGQCD